MSKNRGVHYIFNMTPEKKSSGDRPGDHGGKLGCLPMATTLLEKLLEHISDFMLPTDWSSILKLILSWYCTPSPLSIPCYKLRNNLIVIYAQVSLTFMVTFDENGPYQMIILTHHYTHSNLPRI